MVLEWNLLPHKQSKILKIYVENFSELILEGNLAVHQLAGMDPAEIVVPFNKDEINKLWPKSKPWEWACNNFGGDINKNNPPNKRIQLVKRTK